MKKMDWNILKEKRRGFANKHRSQVRDIHGNTRTALETVASKAIDKWRMKNRMLKQFEEKDGQIL